MKAIQAKHTRHCGKQENNWLILEKNSKTWEKGTVW